MKPTQEHWLPVPGYEGIYEVSDRGRMRSLDRHVHRTGVRGDAHVQGRILKGSPNSDGYLSVDLRDSGRRQSTKVHRVVALAFLGEPPEGAEVAHWDGDRANNSLSNLRYDTRTGNQRDRYRHHTDNRGERSGKAKLTTAGVIDIRRRIAAGDRLDYIARDFGVSPVTISGIKARRRWAWLKES